MKISLPELSLVVLVGASGSGKSTFARRHFKATEVVSSDFCRALVSDDENDQSATKEAFDLLHVIASKRLTNSKLTVIDATNVQKEARQPLVALAREQHVLPVAIVLDVPEHVCHDRNQQRADRNFGPHVIRNQIRDLKKSIGRLQREGFRHVFVLRSLEDIETVEVERQPLWNNRKADHGPFDIIGDVHGCFDELTELLGQLGYNLTANPPSHPEGRRLVFVGDLVDRGPNTPAVLKLVMDLVAAGLALCIPGNHDVKLVRKLRGRDVQITHGLAESLTQLESVTPEFKTQAAEFLDGLISHYVFDEGKLVVAHAGLKENMQGRASGVVREFALYGETTGEFDDFGLPVRLNWAAEYRGKALVVYGHTPVREAQWLNNTVDIDTGCVFGGSLTALRYPERDLVSVPAAETYYQPARPLDPDKPALTVQQQYDDVLDIADVLGKQLISTRLRQTVIVREENAIAALEVMSRFAANPKWLIYLPPTMSPSETSAEPGLLEHPTEAFAYYRNNGIPKVVCEAKHMGSRAVVVICKSEETAQKRFGISGEGLGICYTRTGRRFFDDPVLEAAFLAEVHSALDSADFWERFNTDWACFDCELLPWSAKARELLRTQYAAVGAAATAGLAQTVALLGQATARSGETTALLTRFRERSRLAGQYIESYRRYCWPVNSLADLKLAPFHLLATEGTTHLQRDHVWHMDTLASLCTNSLLLATAYKVVDVTDPTSEAEGVAWWTELTAAGGEGMVVKPLDFVVRGPRGLVQPAVKCRGREYLRIIYGPEYDAPENLVRLRSRGLGGKRSLALREFALGVESLERFVRQEPLRRVHECVFGVLALESEPVDPRL
jgi:protein phosphatase